MKITWADDFPFWLAAKQTQLLPVSKEVPPWAETALKRLKTAGLRMSLERFIDAACQAEGARANSLPLTEGAAG
jgi:threonyl-tRNA synthetase